MAAYYATPSSSVVAHTSALQPYGQYPELGDPNQSVSVYDLPTDSENEAEVDELESDTDPEDELATSASANHKKSGRRLGERAPGTTLLPAARVESMVQADTSIAMSKEAVFILSIATEEFVKRLAQAGQRQASAKRRGIVNYTDLACSTQQYQEFMFLQDTMPEPISIVDALERRAMKEKEDLEANPAMSTTVRRQSPPFIAVSAPQLNGKSKAKPRPPVASGETSSASANGSTRKEHRRNEDRVDGVTSRSRSVRAADEDRYVGPGDVPSDIGKEAGYHQDDVSWTAPVSSPRRTIAGLRASHEIQEGRSPPHPDFAPKWPGHYTGPASGFLQDSQGAFGRGVSQNPGRTIYSQEPRPENGSYA
ncbi:hypothetical protein K503DRAFT_706615 [Rhizopogon vinicolor AM-OR11-026]|uniref:Transcription factor CBF/NF-Y/archaeal histone domain-containing protein n=1 Tax=Rhizopogon vinicolor AM-OR11-026 TaxID=1314800 RepID=A0A1B7NHM2_9AGAM|nr:hypothetical protein K503DRAFT_706615 [Rhizopogon vinicolor AM-OR11-026]